jgi:hypothetical protein
MISSSPLLAGWLHWELNADWDADAAGSTRGAFRLEADAGGVWEGRYTGDRRKAESVNVWIGDAHFVGRGTAGAADGKQLIFTKLAITFRPMAVFWAAEADAKVVATPPR